MFRRSPAVWLPLLLIPPLLAACTTTTVTKNPDDCDRGIRYYRPKPYLLIQPADHHADESVSISLEYLPDFSEEYSIRVRAGLGINQTSVVLKDGWNLTQIDQKLDSQVDENIGAVADLIGSLPIPTAARSRGGDSLKMVVKATNVPLGFYESVIAQGPDRKKRLCGWRYVGFYPFNAGACQLCGTSLTEDDPFAIYALVFDRGVMTFKPIGMIAHGSNHDREILDRETIHRLPPLDLTARPALNKIRTQALVYLRQMPWGKHLAANQIAARCDGDRAVVVTVRLTPAQRQAAVDLARAARQLKTQLLPDVRHALLDEEHQLRIEWAR